MLIRRLYYPNIAKAETNESAVFDSAFPNRLSPPTRHASRKTYHAFYQSPHFHYIYSPIHFFRTMNRTKLVTALLLVALITGCIPQKEKKAADTPSQHETVVNNIMSRRSIRKYKTTPIDSTALKEILLCGINAPNGQGRESWQVRVADNRRLINRIDSLYGAHTAGQGKTARKASYGAPVLVFIAYDTTYDLSQVDCGLLGGNMMLAANSMGIGSCCLGGLCRFINSDRGNELRNMLDLPPTHRLLYAIAFGYPDENPPAKPRKWDRIQFIKEGEHENNPKH